MTVRPLTVDNVAVNGKGVVLALPSAADTSLMLNVGQWIVVDDRDRLDADAGGGAAGARERDAERLARLVQRVVGDRHGNRARGAAGCAGGPRQRAAHRRVVAAGGRVQRQLWNS